MKPRSYPITQAIYRAIRRVSVVVLALLAFIVFIEVVRFSLLLRRLHPLAGMGFLALFILIVLVLTVRTYFSYAQRKTLFAPKLPPPEKATFKEMKGFVRHLVARLKRLGGHPALDSEMARNVRQRAYDLDSALNAHPLLDDLRRSIGRTEVEFWNPAIEQLDRDAIAFARYKMQAVVRDSVEPPFPGAQPLLTFYHQFTMLCCLVDCYLTRPSLFEYATVIRDVWRVMVRGEYFRIGQRLFDGVYRNSPPAGPAAEELGQALSVIWLTWSCAQATMHRCRNYGAWSVDQAISHLDHLTIDSLLVTRDTLIRDVYPMLKLRLRHSVGPAVADAAGFSEQVIEGIAKSVDAVIQGLRSQGPEQAAEQSRRTLHGLYHVPTAQLPRRKDEGKTS